jgi:hypothetical protein
MHFKKNIKIIDGEEEYDRDKKNIGLKSYFISNSFAEAFS